MLTAKSFFLVYLGSLLACSILLFTLVKQFAGSFGAGGKKPVLYGSFSSIIASLGAYAATYVTKNLFTVFWIFAGIFLSFGIIHMVINHKKYFSSDGKNGTKNFIGEVLFAMSVVLFTVLVFSSLQYFLTKDGKNFLFYPMMLSTLAFFIPVLVMHTFEAAYEIPPPVYPTWLYPDKPLNLPEDDPREKLLVIGFEISKKITDTKRTYFRAKAPENIYFGDLYYFFLNDYNEVQSETPIEFCDKSQAPCEWVFRLKRKWYQGRKILDPALSVKDNGIKENSVIVCQRI
jgi:hypothetical protein